MTARNSPQSRRSVTVERFLSSPVDRAWDAITDPTLVSRWFVPAEIQAWPGGTVRFKFPDYEATGIITRMEPPRLLEFTWTTRDTSESTVRIMLTPTGSGCTLTLTHSFAGDGISKAPAVDWAACIGGLGVWLISAGWNPSAASAGIKLGMANHATVGAGGSGGWTQGGPNTVPGPPSPSSATSRSPGSGPSTRPARSGLPSPGAWVPAAIALAIVLGTAIYGANVGWFTVASSTSTGCQTASPPLSNDPVNGTSYQVPMTVRNSQHVATGVYQQPVEVDSRAWSAEINANWSNVEFAYSGGALVPAWVESNASNTSSSTLVWLRMQSIPPSCSVTVYMDLFPKTDSRLSETGPTGENPTLSPRYAEYDNGWEIFGFYDNFSGRHLSSQWSVSGNWTGNYSVDNGFTAFSDPGAGSSISSVARFAYPAVVDFYGNLFQTDQNVTTFLEEGMGSSACLRCSPPSAAFVGFTSQAWGNGPTPTTGSGANYSYGVSDYFSNQTFAVYTTQVVSASNAEFLVNYSREQSLPSMNASGYYTNVNNSNPVIPRGPQPLDLLGTGEPQGKYETPQVTYWIRERTYEADMPNVTINATSGPSPVLSAVPGLPSPSETPGDTARLTADLRSFDELRVLDLAAVSSLWLEMFRLPPAGVAIAR